MYYITDWLVKLLQMNFYAPYLELLEKKLIQNQSALVLTYIYIYIYEIVLVINKRIPYLLQVHASPSSSHSTATIYYKYTIVLYILIAFLKVASSV